MSGTSGGGEKTGTPSVFEGDLDLDSWDATFDALTSGPLDLASDPASDPALDPLAAAPMAADDDVTSTRIPSLALAGGRGSRLGPPVPVPVAPATTRKSSPPPPVIPRTPAPPAGRDETDFSELGFAGPPEALGSLLGQPPELPPIHEISDSEVFEPTGFEEDEVFTSAVRPGSVMPGPETGLEPGDHAGPVAILPGDDAAESPAPSYGDATRVAEVPRELLDRDETVDRPAQRGPGSAGASSASRAAAAPDEDPSDDTFDRADRTRVINPGDALLAEARGPERAGPPARRPAIVRRAPVPLPTSVPAPVDDEDNNDFADGGFGGGESTRVADLRQLEQLAAHKDARHDPRSNRPAPTFPPPPEEDPYDDIEIGGDPIGGDDEESSGVPAREARRVTSHVVRRAAPEASAASDTVLEMETDDDEPVVPPRPVAGELDLDAAFDLMDGEREPSPPSIVAAVEAVAAVEVVATVEVESAVPDLIEEPAATVAPDGLDQADPADGMAPAVAALDLAAIEMSDESTELTSEPAPPAVAAALDEALALDDASDFADDPQARTTIGVPPAPAARLRPVTAPARMAAPVALGAALEPPSVAGVAAVDVDPNADLPPSIYGDELPGLDLDALALPEHSALVSGDDSDEVATAILALDRELELIDEPAQVAVLRVESGRLYERLGDADRARAGYEAALLADPRATAALRGLRRLARGAGDLTEATRHLDAELGLAGPLERRALGQHRVDLLMAAGDQDLARVAVGELIDEARGDVRAQLAQLELSFLDGRADELGEALERLGAVLADPAVRAAAEVARAHLHERAGDAARARASFTAALTADPGALAARLGLMRTVGGAAMSELASQVDDLAVRAALHLRAAALIPTPATDLAAAARCQAVAAAGAAAGGDPVVQAALVTDAVGRGEITDELCTLAESAADPGVRRHAALWTAARLAPEDPRAAALYSVALAAVPRDDHAASALADRWITTGNTVAVAELLAVRAGSGSAAAEHDRVRAAGWFLAAGRPDDALALYPGEREVDSPAAVDAWGEVLAAVGRLGDRAELFAAAAIRDDERLDARLWAGKAALALDRAADPAQPRSLVAALDAWTKVIEIEGDVERAHARALALAATLGDPDILGEVLGRAQAAAQPPAAAGSLGVLRARTAVAAVGPSGQPDWGRADDVLRELPGDDPRRLATAITLAARGGRWKDAAAALEDHATAIATRSPVEAALLRYRAAGMLLDRGDDPARAGALLNQIAEDQPQFGFVHDLQASARRRLGDAAGPTRASRESARGADAFARLVRDADHAAAHGDAVAALALYGRALDLRPQDPLVAEPLARVARAVREAGPVTALALADLRLAEDTGDANAKADAYEALGRIDRDLRDDRASALIAFEAAADADPTRHALLRELERAYIVEQRWADLARLRGRQLAALPALEAESTGDDAIAFAMDRAQLLEKLERPDDELRLAYQVVVERAPRARQALFHLESLVRRGGSSPDLATLEDAIAAYFVGDPRTRSAFLTRGGETLTDLGRIDEAIAHFRAADQLRGGHVPALEGWREAALRGQLWADFADAAAREATLTTDMGARARLFHLAGVALMDRALAGERAADALRAALDADPRHVDAFVRLRLLFEEQGEHERLAELLEQRLAVEDDRTEQLGLHRAIAELSRNFLENRDAAKQHYRAIVEAMPGDLRAVAALSDIAWEQGAWAECAAALDQRARLERDPHVLRNVYFRLGVIHAERLPNPPAAVAAFQRVLSYDADDEAALERLADLGIATEQWKMALGACERLVKNETVALRKVAHLHRVGRIFAEGFGDRRRAERAYQLAVDAAPDSDVALGALIKFYEDAGDVASIRVHLGLVAASMRSRLGSGVDPMAIKVIARVARARHDAGVLGQGAVARASIDIARLLGVDGGEPPLLPPVNLGALIRPEIDEVLWPRSVTPELRQIFALLGERLAKHVGIDLRPYGVTRGDRLRPQASPVAAAAQEVADALGLGELDVYVSARQPFAMVAEPTSPISLILGAEVASPDRLSAVRFAAGGALVLARAQLAIAARLPVDELGVLVVALLRLFQPDLPYLAVDNDLVASQLQRLKRLVPSGLMSELRPYALGIHAAAFDHRALARDLEMASHRAGLLAAGGAAAPLRLLLARAGAPDLAAGMNHHEVAELVRFAISEDHAAMVALATPNP